MRQILLSGIIIAAAAAVMFVAMSMNIMASVDTIVRDRAANKATDWAHYAAQNVPGIQTLIATGHANAAQSSVIDSIRSSGDVFGVKLFDRFGRLTFVSKEADLSKLRRAHAVLDPKALAVLNTGQVQVTVHAHEVTDDLPAFFAEAYAPVVTNSGDVIGVVEIYLDKSATREYFRQRISKLGVTLALGCAMVFALMLGALFWQNRAAQRARSDAEFHARVDPMTELLNRKAYTERLASERPSAIGFMDLDSFKQINDQYGHAAGDALLQHVAAVLRRVTAGHSLAPPAGADRRLDGLSLFAPQATAPGIAARFGGDEFAFAFFGLSPREAQAAADAIVQGCAEPVNFGGATMRGSVSIGLCLLTPADSVDTAIRNADAALYSMKASGKNGFAVFGEEMNAALERRRRIEPLLKSAVENGGFALMFQPMIDVRSGAPAGYEALLRLSGDDAAEYTPEEFVPIAEQLGLITEIGQWVINAALSQAAEWPETQSVAVNLAPAQFRNGDLAAIVSDALSRSGVAPHRLELEVTEALLMDASLKAEHQLDMLRELGVRLVLDDYGVGPSSLAALWRFHIDHLKLDRAVVSALVQSPDRGREIIETVLAVAKVLNITVTAEGIESHEQGAVLTALGFHRLQGFHHGRPASGDALIGAMAANLAEAPRIALAER